MAESCVLWEKAKHCIYIFIVLPPLLPLLQLHQPLGFLMSQHPVAPKTHCHCHCWDNHCHHFYHSPAHIHIDHCGWCLLPHPVPHFCQNNVLFIPKCCILWLVSMLHFFTEVRTIGQLAKLTTYTESDMQREYEYTREGFEREIGTVQVRILNEISLPIL